MLNPFPKIWAVGHRNISGIFDKEVEVTEKVDGSQFVFGWDLEGKFHCRSKGAVINPDESVPNLFGPVVKWARGLEPDKGITYYGETLCRPKHNTLEYSKHPTNHFVLFGMSNFSGDTHHHGHKVLSLAAKDLGCDVVPLLYEGKIDFEGVKDLMKRDSYLGGVQMEGVVIKTPEKYELFGQECPIMCGKYVSEEFKEKHTENPEYRSNKNKMQELLEQIKGDEARWTKAVNRLRESGDFQGDPRDIGALMKIVSVDFEEEEAEAVKEALWNAFRKDFLKVVGTGLPAWYKEALARGDFK